MRELPAHDLITKGIDDLKKKLMTIESLLVLIGAPKLKFLGFSIPDFSIESPEHKLYELLENDGDGAHSRYNSLIRKLVSFERAYGCVNK